MELTEKFTFNPKEGIDNPAMINVADSEAVVAPTPRLCVLKREESENFGFHLRVEKGLQGHVIRQVAQWGVAERNGVRDGDRLLEVNESFVDHVGHIEVARRIQISGTHLCLLVLDGKEYEQAVAQGYDLKALTRAQRGEDWEPPRLCHIARDSSPCLGLRILPVEGEKGKFSMSPASGGAAEKAGVRKGDRLIWLDGATVSELSHSAISKMVKKCGDHMTVLVIDSKSEQTYTSRRMPILPAMAVAHNLPHKPQKQHLVQGPEGYGFLLRQEKTASKRAVHALREVDPHSPAELLGIQEGELLLGVNEELIVNMRHNDVVNRIRQSGQQVTLTTISSQGLDFFTRLGLSPLLFYEDLSAAEPIGSAKLHQTADHCSDLQCVPAEEPPRPRRCVFSKGPNGYGFHLGCVLLKPGTFISQVAAEGPGGKTGLLKGDVVMEVNGANVEEEYLEDVIVLVKEGGSSLSLLVIEPKGYEKLLQSRIIGTAEKTADGS